MITEIFSRVPAKITSVLNRVPVSAIKNRLEKVPVTDEVIINGVKVLTPSQKAPLKAINTIETNGIKILVPEGIDLDYAKLLYQKSIENNPTIGRIDLFEHVTGFEIRGHKFISAKGQAILDRYEKFGLKDYNALTSAEKKILKTEAQKLSLDKEYGIEVENIVTIADKIKKSLDNKYGAENYIVVGIGQSPLWYGKTLKLMGKDFVYMPGSEFNAASQINKFLDHPNLDKYLEYLKKCGLDPDTVSSLQNKKVVFIDYAQTGRSIENFEQFVKNPKVGLDLKNVEFQTINELLREDGRIYYDPMLTEYLARSRGKNFSDGFKLRTNDDLANLDSLLHRKQRTGVKLVEFALIDYLKTSKII